MDWNLIRHTALVIVDVQQDFCGAEGLMAQYGVDMQNIEAAIDRIEQLTLEAKRYQVPIIYLNLVTDVHTDLPVMKTWYSRQGLNGEEVVAICRRDTFGAEQYRLQATADDYIVEKQRYSGFVNTKLDLVLKHLGIEKLIVTGVTTECCVDSTVRDAFMHNYEIFIAADACAAYEDDVHVMSLKILGMNFATILPTSRIIELWNEV